MEQKQYTTPTARLIPIEAEQLLSGSEEVPLHDEETLDMLSKQIGFRYLDDEEEYDECYE